MSLNSENAVDKDRFDKFKATEEQRGRDAAKARDVAVREVKELRKRERRRREDDLARGT